ncbi:MAG: RecX family transcriptional regulator [Chloroflexi bacterium]|nr:RecX family transcriptional regulator [Chloroflexota bacterium]
MPVVTGLEVHQRDKERVRLYLDDEYALDLPLMEAARLSRGQALTESEVAALSGVGAVQRAYDQALRFLSYRPRSIDEVRRQLVRKSVPPSLVALVIERLQARGYVDDAAFAEFWIANRNRFKPMGLRALRYELRQKGLADDIVHAALADFDESGSAYRAADARASRYRGLSRESFRRKLGEFLRRRGFSGFTINDVTRRLLTELEERDPAYFHDNDAE